MDKKSIPLLAELLDMYYQEEELLDLAGVFDVQVKRLEEAIEKLERESLRAHGKLSSRLNQ